MTAAMRRFELYRDIDHSGISGTGVIVQGAQFADGTCAIRWLSPTPSTAVFGSVEVVLAVHGHGGDTRLIWLDD